MKYANSIENAEISVAGVREKLVWKINQFGAEPFK